MKLFINNKNVGLLLCSFFVGFGMATLKINGQEVPATSVLKAVIPDYPVVAASLRKSGTVIVEATIDSYGLVTNVAAADGDIVLRNSALMASRQWLFSKDTGKSTRLVRIHFRFQLLEHVAKPSDLWSEFVSPYHLEIRSRPIVVRDSPNIDPKIKRKKRAT